MFDRRHAERRRREAVPHAGMERRRAQRRRAWNPEERAVWSELRFLTVYAGEVGGAAPWTVDDGTKSEVHGLFRDGIPPRRPRGFG